MLQTFDLAFRLSIVHHLFYILICILTLSTQNTTFNVIIFLQLINITKHLSKSSRDIASKIPDPDFKGVAVIDWEGWRPLWETNSFELVKKENVLFKKREIKNEAKRRFENAARHLMEETITLAKQLRPKALWGFYGFPGCHGNITSGYTCRKKVQIDMN